METIVSTTLLKRTVPYAKYAASGIPISRRISVVTDASLNVSTIV